MTKNDKMFLIYLLKKAKNDKLKQDCSKENSTYVDCCDYILDSLKGSKDE